MLTIILAIAHCSIMQEIAAITGERVYYAEEYIPG